MSHRCPQERVQLEEGPRWMALALITKWGFEEGDLRALFAGEDLRLVLFNFWEAGLIPKAEPL
jgi:hypothetical protein